MPIKNFEKHFLELWKRINWSCCDGSLLS